VKVKICGITGLQDAEAAIEAGADFLGFNFYPKSPRYLEPESAGEIISALGPGVKAVGVFVNETPAKIRECCSRSGAGVIQLHGDESPELAAELSLPVIKAVRLGGPADLIGIEDYRVWALLADSQSPGFGGSGKTANWDLARQMRERSPRLFLAGGLTPDNVAEAIITVRPWAVDVCSGVEREPGVKDRAKLKKFMEAVKDVA